MEELDIDYGAASLDTEDIEIVSAKANAFTVTDDGAAEWVLKKIRQRRLNHERFVASCNQSINEYRKEIDKIQHKLDADAAELQYSENYFNGLLAEYMLALPSDALKTTKTQRTYRLPSGKLVYKLPTTRLKHDDKTLLSALDAIAAADLIRVKREPDWVSIKKMCTTAGDIVTLTYECETVDPETGEIMKTTNKVEGIPGIGIEAVPGEIKVEVD